MPLRIKCPTGHTLIVPDDRAGRTLKCPRCDQSVVVPSGEVDAVGSALLSVLAEGIPAANLAAGSLRVAPIEPRVGSGSLRTAEALAPSQPPKPPRPKTPATQTPVVKPKSRVLPAQAPRPEPMHPEPVQPAPVEPKPEPPKSELTKVAPPTAPPIEAPPPAQPPLAEQAVVEPAALPPVAIQAPAPPSAPDPEPLAVEAPAPFALIAAAEVPQPTVEILAAPPPWASLATYELDEPDVAPPLAAEPPIVAEPPAPPPFVPRAQPPVTVNLNADAARTLAVYQLAVALAAAALFSVVPAVWDVVEYLQFAESPFVARWALGLFFLGVVQLAYAVYLFQLPDWTTVWVVTLLSLMLAAIYAAVLGLVLLTPADGFLVGSHGLQLADKLAGGKAALWCLCMVSLWTILAFFAGRQSTSWHQAEMMLRAAAV